MKKILFIIITIMLVLAGWLYFVKGYVGVRTRHAVPEALIYKAEIPGMKNIRFIGDPLKIKNIKALGEIYKSNFIKARFLNKEINVLAISGGGANGAYGAGVLCGWSETKHRPPFDIVTGVSTGALIAPAAFLGESYDGLIKDIYTNISDMDIMKQDMVNFLFEGRPSLLDTEPLRGVLKKAVTQKLLDDVAREHLKGKRLYIGTTNLDAKRLVIWDMGAIASSGSPEALELFRNVMLASASIPVAFPPVMFRVKANGRFYDEMHVDGSVATQLFGPMLVLCHDEVKVKKTNVYVIRNGKFADVPSAVPYKVWDIAGAAFSTLMTWQSYGDLYRFSALARYKRISFFFACIPYEFNEPRKSEFDLSYMRKLFYRGYRIALYGNQWVEPIGADIKDGMRSKK